MRKQKTLVNLLHGLADLLREEAARNPEFATRLEDLRVSSPEGKAPSGRSRTPKAPKHLPDIYAEWNTRGEAEFRLWLRDQPVEVLRAVIRKHDLDAADRTRKWKDAEKLSAYVADQLQARLARGSSFLRSGDPK